MKLSQFKSDITNVESVEKQCYEYWIGLKLWKRSISVLCLFVDMKWLQNETSQISTDLIRNLKIKIILILVLNWYFFENFHFHIELNLINTESYLISFLPQFFLAHAWLALLCLVFFFYFCILLKCMLRSWGCIHNTFLHDLTMDPISLSICFWHPFTT